MNRDARPRSPRAARAVAVAALVALVLVFFWRLAFTEGILARGDVLLYFYPYWDYRGQALAAGRLPLWNPLLFMGAPFLANSQAGVLYPPNWPLALFSAPVAVKITLLSHLALAALGAYLFARRALQQSPLAAGLAAAFFALSGYLASQAEHVNQLQGLAWLPWLLLAAHALAAAVVAGRRGSRGPLLASTLAGLVVSLQLLAGHTQSAFLSVTAALTYASGFTLTAAAGAGSPPVAAAKRTGAGRQLVITLAWLLASLVIALLLAAGQVLPTLELSGQSLRGGGLSLREVLSFSLDPRLLPRALLPGYSRGLFSEFTAYLGVAGLALAALGAAGARQRPERLALAGVSLAGLLFALGAYNPLYVGLAALPPFNLFRVPARWLVLWSFGGAMLAGHGFEDTLAGTSPRRRAAAIALPLLLAAASPLAAGLVPAGETGPLGLPRAADLAGWLAALAVLAALFLLPRRVGLAWRGPAIGAVAIVELFAASQVLSINHLTTPEAWTSVRPAMMELLAAQPSPASDRFLSMSGLRFEPGDTLELRTALGPALPEDAFYDFIVATKHKEVLSPNLPLAWDVPAVDGYDGGVLPLRHYADFTQLFTGAASTDGRLRENVTTPPDPRLLALVNARYLITDKVTDAWIDGVFYDLGFTLSLGAGERVSLAHVPRFLATAIGVVADGDSGSLALTLDDGSQISLPISSRVALPEPSTPVAITLMGPLTVRGLSLVDTRSGAFQSLTLGPYRLVHSGDVKIYEHQALLPRAFVVPSAVVVPDPEALARLADPGFDPAGQVLLAEPPAAGAAMPAADGGSAAIVAYAAERVELRAAGPGYLVLTDAHYPGWTVSVDGEPASILRADVLFRAVALPPGEHTVIFRFQPLSVSIGLGISGAAWVLLLVGVWLLRAGRRASLPQAGASAASCRVCDRPDLSLRRGSSSPLQSPAGAARARTHSFPALRHRRARRISASCRTPTVKAA